MKIIRDDKKNGAPLSLSRTILFLWFIFALASGIISCIRLFVGDGSLPSDISLFYDYITYLSGIFVGGYGVGKGTQVYREKEFRNAEMLRSNPNNGTEPCD